MSEPPVPRPNPAPQPDQPVHPAPPPATQPDVVVELNGNSAFWLSQAQQFTNFFTKSKSFPGGLPAPVAVPAGLELPLPPGSGIVVGVETSAPAGSFVFALGAWLAGPPSSAEQAAMQNGLGRGLIQLPPPAQPDSPLHPQNPDGAIGLYISGNVFSTFLQAVFTGVAGTSMDLTNILGYEVKATLQTAAVSISFDAPVITTTITGSVNTIPSTSFTATITDTLSVVPGQGLVSTPNVSVNADVTAEVILALLSAVLLQPGWLATAGALFFGLQAVATAAGGGQASPALQANSPGTLLAALVNQATTLIAGGGKIKSTITTVGPSWGYLPVESGIVVIGVFSLGVPDPTISLEGASELQWYQGDPAPAGAPVTYIAVTTQIQQPKVTWSLDSHIQVESPQPVFQLGPCDEQISQGIVFPSPGTAIGQEAMHTLTVKAVDGTVQTNNSVVFTASMPVKDTVVERPKPPPPPPPPIRHPPEP